jgi:hypothetical protein
MKAATVPASSVASISKELAQWVSYHQAEGFADSEELLNFIQVFWGVRIPRAKVCPEHTPPAEYVVASFFEDVQDCICCRMVDRFLLISLPPFYYSNITCGSVFREPGQRWPGPGSAPGPGGAGPGQ